MGSLGKSDAAVVHAVGCVLSVMDSEADARHACMLVGYSLLSLACM